MSVLISGTELRAAFTDMKPVFRGLEGSRVVTFTLDKRVLSITANQGILYQKDIPVAVDDYKNITVLYQDIADLIPSQATCKLDFMPTGVTISSPTFRVTLGQASSLQSRYEPRGTDYKRVNREELTYAMKVFSNTTALSKAFMKEAAIVFNAPDALIQYPTVWVRVKNSMLNTVMTMREAKCLASFWPELMWEGDVLEFKRGNAILVFPKNTPPETSEFDELTKGMRDVGTLKTVGAHKMLQDMMRGIGAGECNCYIYPNGAEYEVTRPNVQTSVIMGEKSHSLYTIRTFLEFMIMFMAMANDAPYSVKVGGNKVCLSTSNLSILMYARD